jgi:hypothetical protein
MNAADRKRVAELSNEFREIADAEQGKFDNMPEGLQEGEKGQAISEAAEALGEVADHLESGEASDAYERLGDIEL